MFLSTFCYNKIICSNFARSCYKDNKNLSLELITKKWNGIKKYIHTSTNMMLVCGKTFNAKRQRGTFAQVCEQMKTF